MGNKVLGEITVQFDDGERKFKVRRKSYSQQMHTLALLRQAGSLVKNDKGEMVIQAGSLEPEKYAAYQIDLCRVSLGDDAGKVYLPVDEIDDWGGDNIGAVCTALDVFFGPAKTTVDHAGN